MCVRTRLSKTYLIPSVLLYSPVTHVQHLVQMVSLCHDDALFAKAIDSISTPADSDPDSQISFETYWDDLSGKPLSPDLVLKARTEEMGEILKHKVYEKVIYDIHIIDYAAVRLFCLRSLIFCSIECSYYSLQYNFFNH